MKTNHGEKSEMYVCTDHKRPNVTNTGVIWLITLGGQKQTRLYYVSVKRRFFIFSVFAPQKIWFRIYFYFLFAPLQHSSKEKKNYS